MHIKASVHGKTEERSNGGYIMDASAIMQNDTKIENLKALTDFTREYGIYSSGTSRIVEDDNQIAPPPDAVYGSNYGMSGRPSPKTRPGVCIPWEEKIRELPDISGDKDLVQHIWEDIDQFGNMFIWQCLLSF